MSDPHHELGNVARVAQEAAALRVAAVAAELSPEQRAALDNAIASGARPFLVTYIAPRAPRLEVWLLEGAERTVATIDPNGRKLKRHSPPLFARKCRQGKVIDDSTVQEKAIAHPVDSRLLKALLLRPVFFALVAAMLPPESLASARPNRAPTASLGVIAADGG